MRVIITGGTGLLGRHLAASLLKDSHEVIVLSRDPEGASGMARGVRLEQWDGRSAEGWGHLVDGAGAVVNLAGASLSDGRWTDERKRVIRDSRVAAGQAVVEAVTRADRKPAVVLQASAVGFYGPRGDDPVTEEAPNGSDFLAAVCRDWEEATAAVEAQGVRRCILRTGIVLSTAGGALPRLAQPFKLFVGGPVGSGRQWMPWIHLDDELGAMRFLLENAAARGAFNLGAPNPVTNRDFGRALGRVLGRPAVMPAPAFAMKLLFGEMSTILLEGQRMLPAALHDAGYLFKYATVNAALTELYG